MNRENSNTQVGKIRTKIHGGWKVGLTLLILVNIIVFGYLVLTSAILDAGQASEEAALGSVLSILALAPGFFLLAIAVPLGFIDFFVVIAFLVYLARRERLAGRR